MISRSCTSIFLKKYWLAYAIPMSAINGLLYFTIAIAGANNLQKFLNIESGYSIYIISVGASVCYGMFTYKSFEYLSLIPKSAFSWCFVILSPFAASSFLTAGIEGSEKLNLFNLHTAIVIGIILFVMRTINFIDGAVKFPDRLSEIKFSLMNSLMNRNYKNLFCIIIVIYTTLGYSLSTTDSIYSASIKIFTWFGMLPGQTLTTIGYASSGVGMIIGIPMIFYWTQRGLAQLSNSGVKDKNGVMRDVTDVYTYIGLIASLPVILGSLGAATSSSAQVFGKLGLFSEVVRVSTSVIFAVCGGVPGLSTLIRGFFSLIFITKTSSQTLS